MKKEYDYLLVGAGLFNAVFAQQAKMHWKRCLVIDKRPHLGGNIYCAESYGITIHKYGPHIFHTSDEEVWQFVNKFADFNRFTLNTIANNKGRLFNLPFNMHTFYQMWGVTDIEKAKAIIESQRMESGITDPDNLEEKAISLVGKDVYEMLIKGYTEKQWGKPCNELPYCLDGDAALVTPSVPTSPATSMSSMVQTSMSTTARVRKRSEWAETTRPTA